MTSSISVSPVILFCLFYSRTQAASQSKKGMYFPNFWRFSPNLRILLGFISKFKGHRLYPKKGNKITVHCVKTKVLGSQNEMYLSGVIFYLDLTFLMTNRTYFSGVVALKAKIIGWISGAGN